jgi:hypothetical protein
LTTADRAVSSTWNPLLDCQLIALSFAVNVFGKARVRKLARQVNVRVAR